MDCSSEPANPVCGTDNATYRSKCELQQTACRGGAASQEAGQPPIPVALQYRGVCVESRWHICVYPLGFYKGGIQFDQ